MGRKGKEAAAKAGVVETMTAAQLGELSLTTTTTFKPNDAADPFDLLDMCVAALQDKRGPTREHAMAALCGALEALPPLDELDSRCLTVFALCGVSIKKAATNPKEARLAYRAVGLLALTLRAGAPDLLAHAFPLLSKTLRVQAAHDDAPTLVAALDCLAAVTFAGALDVEDVDRSMKAVWAVIFPSASSRPTVKATAWRATAQVAVAAVSAWTFLVTTVPMTASEVKTSRASWNAAVASLAGLLEHGDRAVRMAAGEALAVCIELNLAQYVPKKDMEIVVATVRDLAIEAGGQGVSKTMLPEQRHMFRQVVAFLDHDEQPTVTVTVRASTGRRNHVLKVSTWAKVVQLNFLRSFLGGGFLKHVQDNELFKEAFSFDVQVGKRLSIAKRKEMDKNRDKSMNVRRDLRWECKHVLCLESRSPDKVLQLGWH
ncbi:hypothetical protein QOZ80_2AG0106330 [Eleusine coracana subsp. coracana]|nr:hypothetical protein QOZ80_2AG0106330 [Eleusine coracana subsp. coracana]